MKPANSPPANSNEVRLLVVKGGSFENSRMNLLPDQLDSGDLLVVNDAATIPASLQGMSVHGEALEIRLTRQLDNSVWEAVAFGAGDWRQPTEKRQPPSTLRVKDGIVFAPGFSASVVALSQVSDRLLSLDFNLESASLLRSVYRYGKPVQYSYMLNDLKLWSVQNIYSSRPWAVEMPSAGHGLTWSILLKLFKKGINVVSLTHGAGLSSTGDNRIDAALPLAERFEIPQSTMDAVVQTRASGGMVIAAGTSVVRALESADENLSGTTTLRIGEGYRPRIVDGLLTGTHEVTESHYQLLSAFLSREALTTMTRELEREAYRTHEFGDLCLIFQSLT